MGVSAAPETLSLRFSPQRIWFGPSSWGLPWHHPLIDLLQCVWRRPSFQVSMNIQYHFSQDVCVFVVLCSCLLQCVSHCHWMKRWEALFTFRSDHKHFQGFFFIYFLRCSHCLHKCGENFWLCMHVSYQAIWRDSPRFYSPAERTGMQADRPAGQRKEPILLSPLTPGRKGQRYLSLRFLCSLCLAPPIEDTKKWAWRETRHRAPSRFSSALGSTSPRDGVEQWEKSSCRIPVLMATSPPSLPFCQLTHVLILCHCALNLTRHPRLLSVSPWPLKCPLQVTLETCPSGLLSDARPLMQRCEQNSMQVEEAQVLQRTCRQHEQI